LNKFRDGVKGTIISIDHVEGLMNGLGIRTRSRL